MLAVAMMRFPSLAAGLVVVALLVATACSSAADAPEPTTTVAPSTRVAPSTAAAPATSPTTTTPGLAPTTTTTVPPTTSTTVPPTTSTTVPPTTTTTEPAADVVISVALVGGRIEGERRYEAALGDTVEVRVTSDVAEEVHLHGYDLLLQLEAGGEVTLTFEANLPGVWEAELHPSHRELFQLQVS